MSFRDVMEMPIRSFWCYYGRISALEAEEKLDAVDAALCSMGGEFAKSLRTQLHERLNNPIVVDRIRTAETNASEMHSAGINRLKALGGRAPS